MLHKTILFLSEIYLKTAFSYDTEPQLLLIFEACFVSYSKLQLSAPQNAKRWQTFKIEGFNSIFLFTAVKNY